MIRGMTKLNLGPSARKACRVPLLAVLLILGAGLAKADPKPLSVDEFTAEIAGQGLHVHSAPFPTTVVIHDDGRATISSALGTWQGQWAGQADTLCLFFEAGPVSGQTCAEVSRSAEGQYLTSLGTRLSVVARAKSL
ncbi:MAG: hypothetical protein AAGF78_14550 [Pseudomonadota bacterium]